MLQDVCTLRCGRKQPSLWRPPRVSVERLLVIVIVTVRVMVTLGSLILCVTVLIPVNNTQTNLYLSLFYNLSRL